MVQEAIFLFAEAQISQAEQVPKFLFIDVGIGALLTCQGPRGFQFLDCFRAFAQLQQLAREPQADVPLAGVALAAGQKYPDLFDSLLVLVWIGLPVLSAPDGRKSLGHAPGSGILVGRRRERADSSGAAQDQACAQK